MHLLLAVLLAQWLQVFDTSAFWPPFADPTGITFANGNLLVVDSEVGETTILDRDTMFEMTTEGVVRSSISLQGLTKEPTGIAYDSATRTVFISEDDRGGRIHSLHPGPDKLLGTADDTVVSLRVRDIGIPSRDMEGLAFHDGRLYLAAGGDVSIYVVTPGPEGFDEGSVLVDVISVAPMRSVEGITIHNGVIYAVGAWRNRIYAFDLSGVPLGQQRFQEGALRSPAGIAYDDSSGMFYITDRGLDNDSHPDENDGKIYVIESQF